MSLSCPRSRLPIGRAACFAQGYALGRGPTRLAIAALRQVRHPPREPQSTAAPLLMQGYADVELEGDVRGRPREAEQDADVGRNLEVTPQGDLGVDHGA